MTDMKLQDDTVRVNAAREIEPPDPRRIPVRFEARDLFIEVRTGETVEHLLTIVATDHGVLIENIYIVREGDDAPLACDHPIHNSHQRRHHVHHRQPVTITVNYQAASHHREFLRHATLEAVLDWAIGAFGIDTSMAGEFELTRSGSADELPLSDQVGHLAGKQDVLALDLVRGDIANGGRNA